jgi:hypothetical protein
MTGVSEMAEIDSQTRLCVSSDGRRFETEDGHPFLYLADTAWGIFKRLDVDEVEVYLANRVAKGFTVIQAYVLRGLEVPNLSGHVPLVDRDPRRLNEGFFRNLDAIVARANELGLVMAMVATHGQHVSGPQDTTGLSEVARQRRRFGGRDEKIFDAPSAFAYGEILGRRYRDNCVIWLLGGDRSPAEADIEVWNQMALGLKSGSGGRHLVSYHDTGGHSSSEHFHQFNWFDFNTIQSRHASGEPNYLLVERDYALTPSKPTLDMECRYEEHPDLAVHDFYRVTAGEEVPVKRIDAHQIREAAYWAILAGAAGHGYGNNDVWQMYDERKSTNLVDYDYSLFRNPHRRSWFESIDSDGAFSISHLRRLLELLPWHQIVPDQSIIAGGQGEGEDHVQAARAVDGSFALAYLTFGNPVSIDLGRLSSALVIASWFDPRTGDLATIDTLASDGIYRFVSPSSGRGNDWVLVLDTADDDAT